MTSDAETRLDWLNQIAMIRASFEAALRAGETFDSIDLWLKQVPPEMRPRLRDELLRSRESISPSSIETRVLSSDAILACEIPEDGFPTESLRSESAVHDCSTFRGLAPEAVSALEAELSPKAFPAGAMLLEQGRPAQGLFLILSGSVDIIDMVTEERIDCDGAGSVLGEMSLLTGGNCSAEVRATTEVDALVLSTESYASLTAAHPELEIALSQLVSDRLGGRRHDALCGKTIGSYRPIHCISRGGMGVVYHAEHVGNSEAVALKMLRHRFIYDDQMKTRFDQEAELLAGLTHPNIVTFREHFLSYRTRFLVLDLCDGCDLFRLLREHGPLDEATTRAILGQVASGLLHAHRAGIIHRDLKPGNVLVDRQGRVKLTDFGLSRLVESDDPERKAVGTPSYMPPEQFRGSDVGPPCDWYAVGCLTYEMLAGKILFEGANWMEIFERKRTRFPSSDWPPVEASDELRRVMSATLQPLPERRELDLQTLSQWAQPVKHLF